MTVRFERRHTVVVDTKRPDASWRQWAYEQAKEARLEHSPGGTLLLQAVGVRSDRAFGPASMWRVADFVIDGLIAAGVFRTRMDIGALTILRSTSDGREGLVVEVSP